MTNADAFITAPNLPSVPNHFHSVRGGPWSAALVCAAANGVAEIHLFGDDGLELDNTGMTALAVTATDMGILGLLESNAIDLTARFPNGNKIAWVRIYCRTAAFQVSTRGLHDDLTPPAPGAFHKFLRTVALPDYKTLNPGDSVDFGWYP